MRMRSVIGFLALLGLLPLGGVLLCCLVAGWHWLPDLATHASPYWFLMAILATGLLLVTKKWLGAALGAVLAICFGWGVVPYLVPSSDDRQPTVLRVLHFNVLHVNDRYADVEAFLREQNADVVVIQELDPKWRTALQGFTGSYPHRLIEPRRGATGMALLSRYPLDGAKINLEADADWFYITATAEVDGRKLDLTAIHPPPPIGGRRSSTRNRIMKEVGYRGAAHGPHIVLGDFNCTPWSPHFRKLRKATGTRDAALGQGVMFTWYPSVLPVAIPIDHVLVSPEISVHDYQVGPNLGSDHRAVTVDLSL